MSLPELSDRERRVLGAVIQSYVATAEPAGSRAIARNFGLGVSPATIRNTMSDLEEKGFLFHPHTSAGRVPTDLAYRAYVESLTEVLAPAEVQQLLDLAFARASHDSRIPRSGLFSPILFLFCCHLDLRRASTHVGYTLRFRFLHQRCACTHAWRALCSFQN